MEYIKEKIKFLFKDVLWHYTVIILLLKTIVFLGFIFNDNYSSFNILKGLSGVSSFAIYLCFIAMLASFSFLFKMRGRLWFLTTLNAVISTLLMMDLWYYRGYGTLLSVHLIGQTANLDNLSDSIFSMVRLADIVFIFDIIVLVVILIKTKNPYKHMDRNVFAFAVLILISVGYICFAHYKYDIVERGERKAVFKTCWAPIETISNLSPIGYHFFDAYNYWNESRMLVLTDEEKTLIKDWYEQKKECIPDNRYKGVFNGKNLIFLQVESLEGFVLNQKINGKEISPNLNRLLKNSIFFSNIREQVYNGTSSDCDLMANTSVYPVRNGSTFFRFPGNTYNSMPKLLENMGYSTQAIHPDKGSYWNWMPALYSIGFQKCIDSTSFGMDETIGLGLSDGSFLRQVIPMIAKQKQPFFTFMVTLTNHGPFDLPAAYRELDLDEELNSSKLGGYFESVHYTDKHIGVFLDSLEKEGLLENTVVVVYGDHCGVHRYYPDDIAGLSSPQQWWLENENRIPLIIYSKGLEGEELKVNGGQIDILPTVAYLMGVEEEEYINTALGRNLLKTQKDFAVLSSREYIGDKSSEKDVQHAIKGIDIADLLIRSNYFDTSAF